jgi:hypothetical protein
MNEAMQRCPTCNIDWSLNPPVKCHGSNHFRCIECKAVYSGEMLAVPEMLAALENMLVAEGYQAQEEAEQIARAAIAKATGQLETYDAKEPLA